jgi:hypothetical protein
MKKFIKIGNVLVAAQDFLGAGIERIPHCLSGAQLMVNTATFNFSVPFQDKAECAAILQKIVEDMAKCDCTNVIRLGSACVINFEHLTNLVFGLPDRPDAVGAINNLGRAPLEYDYNHFNEFASHEKCMNVLIEAVND